MGIRELLTKDEVIFYDFGSFRTEPKLDVVNIRYLDHDKAKCCACEWKGLFGDIRSISIVYGHNPIIKCPQCGKKVIPEETMCERTELMKLGIGKLTDV